MSVQKEHIYTNDDKTW